MTYERIGAILEQDEPADFRQIKAKMDAWYEEMARLGKMDEYQKKQKTVSKFTEELRRVYRDHEKYKLYHAIMGGSLKEGNIEEQYPEDDFPGEHSVKAFVDTHFSFESHS